MGGELREEGRVEVREERDERDGGSDDREERCFFLIYST